MSDNFPFLIGLNDEDNILINHIVDMMGIVEKDYLPRYTLFLNEKQATLCQKLLEYEKFNNFEFYGGYDDAERKVLCLYPEYDHINIDDYPIVPITFMYRKSDKLSHRDFLGALMSLNIARNTIGDIVISDGKSVVFSYSTVAQMIVNEVSKIGRIGVKASIGCDIALNNIKKYQLISGTVASLRLDCVLSLALKTSREKARKIIEESEIAVNYLPVSKTNYLLKEKDIFTVRGFGKFVFEEINGTTKKDRIYITIKKFV
ncbi:MAG: RNA-binding protein [Oscillospiraceae bacterium]